MLPVVSWIIFVEKTNEKKIPATTFLRTLNIIHIVAFCYVEQIKDAHEHLYCIPSKIFRFTASKTILQQITSFKGKQRSFTQRSTLIRCSFVNAEVQNVYFAFKSKP